MKCPICNHKLYEGIQGVKYCKYCGYKNDPNYKKDDRKKHN